MRVADDGGEFPSWETTTSLTTITVEDGLRFANAEYRRWEELWSSTTIKIRRRPTVIRSWEDNCIVSSQKMFLNLRALSDLLKEEKQKEEEECRNAYLNVMAFFGSEYDEDV